MNVVSISLPASTTSARQPLAPGVLDLLLLAGPGLIWGASFLFIAEGLRAVGPYGITFVRILVGFATLALFPGARRRLDSARPVPRGDLFRIAAIGVVWLAFPLSMFPLAERQVSSALTGMLNGAIPLLTAAVASILARRLPGARVAVGLGVGLCGAVLVALPALGEGRSSVAGVAMIVAALCAYGVALNLARPLQLRYGAVPVLWRAQAMALLLTAPLGMRDLLGARWAPGPWLAILTLGALGTGAAYVLLSVAAGRLGATRASATTFLIPGMALALGVLVRGESVPSLAVLGALVCGAGAWLVRRAEH